MRLLHELGMTVSDDTLLEHIRSRNVGEATTPRILRVDDFSFKRRRCWGINVVDLDATDLWTYCSIGGRKRSLGGSHSTPAWR